MDKKPCAMEHPEGGTGLPGLYPGMMLEVLTPDNRLIFVGRIEWFRDRSIQIVDEVGLSLPTIAYNSPVKLRGFYRSQAIAMEGIIIGSTAQMWRIGQLRSLQQSERRKFFRQTANLEACVRCVNEIFGRGRQTKDRSEVPCRIADISVGGALVKTKGTYEEGDWLFLRDVPLIDKEPPFNFTCQIRRVIERGNINVYGCEFHGLKGKEVDRLTRGILALQRKELQARRGNRN